MSIPLDELTILVLEDSPTAMMDVVLKLSKFINSERIFRAMNYEEAVDILEQESIQAALIDLSMPKKNGMNLIFDYMKVSPKLNKIPIVVISGIHDNSLLMKSIENTAMEFLSKPVDAEALEEVLLSISDLIQSDETVK